MTSDRSIWLAPAKLNLFLHITGRRADGYHLLQTVFQFIDYCDELSFQIRDDGQIQRTNQVEGLAAEDDICLKAARLLQQASGTGLGVDLQVDKRIPMGGGLGGGSSNAATTLLALNQLWNTGLTTEALEALGLQLGADVPIFVHGHAAWAEGVGETFTPVELDEPWYLVIAPPVNVATVEIFSAAELTRDCSPITIRDLESGDCWNVCEPVVVQKYPVVGDALKWLSSFTQARLTGTGACVFGTFQNKDEAQQALSRMQTELPDAKGFVAKGLNQSPARYSLKK